MPFGLFLAGAIFGLRLRFAVDFWWARAPAMEVALAGTHRPVDWNPLNLDGAGLESDDHRPLKEGEPVTLNVLSGMRPERKVARLALLWNLHMEDWGGRVAAILADLGGRLDAIENRVAEVESSQDKLQAFRSNLHAFRTYTDQVTKELEAHRRGAYDSDALRQNLDQALAACKPLGTEVEHLRRELDELRRSNLQDFRAFTEQFTKELEAHRCGAGNSDALRKNVDQALATCKPLGAEVERLKRELGELRAARSSGQDLPATATNLERSFLSRYLAIAVATAVGVFVSVLINQLL